MSVASTSPPTTAALTSPADAPPAEASASQGASPPAHSSLDALAQTWGPLAYLADSAWAIGEFLPVLDHFHWNTDKTRIRGVLKSQDSEALNWVIDFRVGPKPNTLMGEVSFGDVKEDVLFRFDDAGILTSDWTRIGTANCRFEVRYVGGAYDSRLVASQGSKPAFGPWSGMYRRMPVEEVAATYERNRVDLANALAEQARRAEEQRQRELEALAAQQRSYEQRSYESARVYDRGSERVYDRGSERVYDRGGPTYQPDILGAFQRGLNEAMTQSDARDAQAMDSLRDAVRQGNAIYEAEQERLRREREFDLERERALAAEREYEAQLAAQREIAARQAREAQEAAAAEAARRAEQERVAAAHASNQTRSSVAPPGSGTGASPPSDCYFVDDHPAVAVGLAGTESEALAQAMAKTNGCEIKSQFCDGSKNVVGFKPDGNPIVDGMKWDCRVSYFCGKQRQVCPVRPAEASRQ